MDAGNMESSFVSVKTVVEFLNVRDEYCCGEDLICTFRLNDYTPQDGDRLAIFKLGWTYIKDYVVFEWVPTKFCKDIYMVVFDKHMLPKKSDDIYQICYINNKNDLFGASSTFQFSSEKVSTSSDDAPPLVFHVEVDDVCDDVKQKVNLKDNEELGAMIRDLKADNSLLRSTLSYILSLKNEHEKSNSRTIAALRTETNRLKVFLENQQREINMLKTKIMGRDEENKLNIEKHEADKKYDQVPITEEERSKGKLIPLSRYRGFLKNHNDYDIGKLDPLPPLESPPPFFPFSISAALTKTSNTE